MICAQVSSVQMPRLAAARAMMAMPMATPQPCGTA